MANATARLMYVVCVAMVGSCATPRSPQRPLDSADSSFVEALIAGDQRTVSRFSESFLDGHVAIPAEWLFDDRIVSPSIVLKWSDDRHDYKFGVERVSEYCMCLMELRSGQTSRQTVADSIPDLARVCNGEKCEPCNSLTYPMDGTVRRRLAEYWSRRSAEAKATP